jgi:hypothetical protein
MWSAITSYVDIVDTKVVPLPADRHDGSAIGEWRIREISMPGACFRAETPN